MPDLNADQRRRRRQLAVAVIERFDTDDRALAARAHAARPDGYPRGGGGEGRSSSVSNPTLGAVLARDEADRDRAVAAFTQFDLAVDALLDADRTRAQALPASTADPELVDDLFCTSCARFGISNPRNTDPKRFAQPNTRCTWCSNFRRPVELHGFGFDPPEWILRKRERGERITSKDTGRAVAEHRRSKRKKRR